MSDCLVTALTVATGNTELPVLGAKIFEFVGNSNNSVYNKANILYGKVMNGVAYSDSACTTPDPNQDRLEGDFYVKPNESISVKGYYETCSYIYIINPSFSANITDFVDFRKLTKLYLRFTNTNGELKNFIEQISEYDDFGTYSEYILINLENTQCKFNGSSVNGDLFVKRTDNNIILATDTSFTNVVGVYDTTTKTWTI